MDLNTQLFSISASDGILELKGIVCRDNRARSMSSLTVWTWRSTKRKERGDDITISKPYWLAS